MTRVLTSASNLGLYWGVTLSTYLGISMPAKRHTEKLTIYKDKTDDYGWEGSKRTLHSLNSKRLSPIKNFKAKSIRRAWQQDPFHLISHSGSLSKNKDGVICIAGTIKIHVLIWNSTNYSRVHRPIPQPIHRIGFITLYQHSSPYYKNFNKT